MWRTGNGYEIEEPLSWVLALIALIFAFEGLNIFLPSNLISPTMIGVTIGFIAHELAHRSVARVYGAAAHFIAYIPGLLLTFLSGLLPIKIIAPGYVRIISIYGFTNPRGVLYSVTAGPLTNIVIALATLLLNRIMGYNGFLDIAFINIWLAFFNLLPIPPLDGSQIFTMDKLLWAGLFLATLTILALTIFP